jgi:hypothetical protein
MGASIHIAVVETGTSAVQNFRIVPPPDTHPRWTDQDLVCLTIKTAGLRAYTSGAPRFDNEVGWATVHMDKVLLEKYEAWLCEPL